MRTPATLQATPASSSVNQGHRLPMNGWHGFHRRPSDGMLPFLELSNLCFVALSVSVGRGNLCFCGVGGRSVLVAMARDTGDLGSTVLTELPIGNDVRGHFAVTVYALGGSSTLSKKRGSTKY